MIRPTDTDIRSDRAHSFVSDMVYELSTHLKRTKVGPFFIISSYEYDHFLSRLKTSIEEKLCPPDADVHFPKGSGHDRGEIDILIALPKHVIFMEVSMYIPLSCMHIHMSSSCLFQLLLCSTCL